MNLFDQIPEGSAEEILTELLTAGPVRIERIVSFGQASPDDFWYDQAEDEWVLLLEGSATLGFEDRPSVDLRVGDHIYLPAGMRHRVEKTDATGRTIWLAVFMPTSKG